MAPRPEATGRLSENKIGYELSVIGLKKGCDYFTQKRFKNERKPTGERIAWDLYFPAIRGFKDGLVVEVKRQIKPGTAREKIAISMLCCVASPRPAFLVLDGRHWLTVYYDWAKRVVAGKDSHIIYPGNFREVMWMDEFVQWLNNSAHLFEREQGVFSEMDKSPVRQAKRRAKMLFAM